MGSVIEILILHALSHQVQGDMPALSCVAGAGLTLAEPEGYVRTFVGEGPAMTALLEEAGKRGSFLAMSSQLLAAVLGLRATNSGSPGRAGGSGRDTSPGETEHSG